MYKLPPGSKTIPDDLKVLASSELQEGIESFLQRPKQRRKLNTDPRVNKLYERTKSKELKLMREPKLELIDFLNIPRKYFVVFSNKLRPSEMMDDAFLESRRKQLQADIDLVELKPPEDKELFEEYKQIMIDDIREKNPSLNNEELEKEILREYNKI